MRPAARPVYLDLRRIRLPLPGWVSILHRVSGVLLFIALPLGTWVLSLSLADEMGFRRIADAAAHPLLKLLLLTFVWALAHHFFAGLRHLALDVHLGTRLDTARRNSVAVLFATVVVTLLAAWRLFT